MTKPIHQNPYAQPRPDWVDWLRAIFLGDGRFRCRIWGHAPTGIVYGPDPSITHCTFCDQIWEWND